MEVSLCFYIAVKESQMWIITLFVYSEDGVSSSLVIFGSIASVTAIENTRVV